MSQLVWSMLYVNVKLNVINVKRSYIICFLMVGVKTALESLQMN